MCPVGEGPGVVCVQVVSDDVVVVVVVVGMCWKGVNDDLEAEGATEEGVVQWVVKAVRQVDQALFFRFLLVRQVEQLLVSLIERKPVYFPLFAFFVFKIRRKEEELIS